MDFKVGEQIAYIPSHADGLDHPDVEYGFITKVEPDNLWCRFWYPTGELRTIRNSELTPKRNVIRHTTKPQTEVTESLINLGYQQRKYLHFFSAGAERDGEFTILTWMVLTTKEALRKVQQFYTMEQFPEEGGWTNHAMTEVQRVPNKAIRKAYLELRDED